MNPFSRFRSSKCSIGHRSCLAPGLFCIRRIDRRAHFSCEASPRGQRGWLQALLRPHPSSMTPITAVSYKPASLPRKCLIVNLVNKSYLPARIVGIVAPSSSSFSSSSPVYTVLIKCHSTRRFRRFIHNGSNREEGYNPFISISVTTPRPTLAEDRRGSR